MSLINERLSSNTYNDLPDVDAVAHLIQEQRLHEKLSALVGPVFRAHRFEHEWGMSLVHRHWRIKPGEIPAERRAGPGNKEYHTTPETLGPSGFTPTVLVSNNGCWQALEFSAEVEPRASYANLEGSPKFLAAVAEILENSGLAAAFALRSMTRDPSPGHVFVEFTDTSRRSIVKEVSEISADKMNILETTWSFAAEGTTSFCVRRCRTGPWITTGAAEVSSHRKVHVDQGD